MSIHALLFFLSIPTCGVQTRRSLLGYFCRRCFISYIKLSYHGLCALQHAISQWKKGQWSPDSDPPAGDDLIDGMQGQRLLCKALIRDCLARPISLSDAYRCQPLCNSRCVCFVRVSVLGHGGKQTQRENRYEKALLVGDDKTAADSLRRYFDQRFHTQPESYVPSLRVCLQILMYRPETAKIASMRC